MKNKKKLMQTGKMVVCEYVKHNRPHDHLKCLRENTNIAPADLWALAGGHVIASSLLRKR